ncbi:hypothetical protein [Bacillus sp. FJAT-27986]|uniref:hypothetical protein n=1 Tax=Bacillus sp. FJAT-27986 TaxID=1743146 RepID=UPI00080AD107|nr:hypothetical protein [Bacillus sp. FJAT-27986]OCA83434.1 hypothetical protein A8L44_11385 [Bacillus sp. FJAT-27986]
MIDLIIGLLINGLVIVAFLNNNKFNAQKLKLSIVSLISTIIVVVVPTLGYRFDKSIGDYYFGFPADILVYHGGMLFSLVSFGFLFNFFFFYWVFKLIVKLGVLIRPVNKGNY